mmetsp:Transcript_6088/g.13865  ORF Transcript_6088/g.13865 Transcript_6088/m.13865 type:complete len:260 (+) Transcript_6088:71-850(+)
MAVGKLVLEVQKQLDCRVQHILGSLLSLERLDHGALLVDLLQEGNHLRSVRLAWCGGCCVCCFLGASRSLLSLLCCSQLLEVSSGSVIAGRLGGLLLALRLLWSRLDLVLALNSILDPAEALGLSEPLQHLEQGRGGRRAGGRNTQWLGQLDQLHSQRVGSRTESSLERSCLPLARRVLAQDLGQRLKVGLGLSLKHLSSGGQHRDRAGPHKEQATIGKLLDGPGALLKFVHGVLNGRKLGVGERWQAQGLGNHWGGEF